MPTPDQARIETEAANPLIARIWRALQPLRSVVSFMNTGAHPDDETSAMLAVLGLRDGINLSYACATRGEGGQNDIGTEAGFDLGTLRTAEMERAAEVLDMRLYWLSQSPDDTITDFGFSKSGEETTSRWGRARKLARFVDIVRAERPDILCPTFLDIPGQHGHHRAMTKAAFEVMDLAADPDFAGSDRPVWAPSKLYLPAWSGAGGAYDDEVPPPVATVTIAGRGRDPVLGQTYARIGQQSRAFHRTQGMGRWVPAGEESDWPLHLAVSRVGSDNGAITDNLAGTLADLDPWLIPAQSAIADALSAFPDRALMLKAAAAALSALDDARVPPEHHHRVAAKRAQLARLIRLCACPDITARLDRVHLSPGDTAELQVEAGAPDFGEVEIAVVPGQGQSFSETTLTIVPDAPPSDPYPDTWDPLAPAAPHLKVTITAEGVSATSTVPLETPPLIQPAIRATLSRTAAILNSTLPARHVKVSLSQTSPGVPSFALPDGWSQSWAGAEAVLTAPDDAAPGLYRVRLTLDGQTAQTLRRFAHGHVAPRLRSMPAELSIRIAPIDLPQARIGYIGAGNDQSATWLRAIGCDVTELDDAALSTPAPFDRFDTILVGVFAMRFRASLLPLIPALQDWVRAGGNLVTQYHRPWDNWDPETVPPARLEIGQPSLRWRVTNEAAEVGILEPDHPLLTTPNRIAPEDWEGWHKERGLYFAKSWDATYTPLLSMSDPGEAPLKGALLSAPIGKGRHTHLALILHHQMAHLVPGAFRLMANLMQPA